MLADIVVGAVDTEDDGLITRTDAEAFEEPKR
jgi:hypothetical protein